MADISDVGRMAGASCLQTHRLRVVLQFGAHIIRRPSQKCGRRKNRCQVNSKVVELLRDADGKVTGVQVWTASIGGLYVIEAKAVVIAAGGFSAYAQMV